MTQLAKRVTLYLRCLACHHRFESAFKNEACPRCSATTKVYGVREDGPTAP